MIIPVTGVHKPGWLPDIPAHRIPLSGWTRAKGVMFLDWATQARYGFTHQLTPAEMPVSLYTAGNDVFVCGKSKIYKGSSDMSRAGGYTGGEDNYWLGDVFNNFLVITNGVDVPQAFDLNGTSPFIDLPGWPSTYRAKSIRPFKNFLVALNILVNSTPSGRMVKWSHPADPNTLPSSWDHTDPSKDAGELTLSEGSDAIVDGVQYYNDMFIFTTTQTWTLRFVGGAGIFGVAKVFNESGLLAPGCVVEVPSLGLVAVSGDDVLLVTGRGESIVDGAVRRELFSSIDPTYYHRTRLVVLPVDKELWILFPEKGSSLLTRAFVWNYKHNSWSSVDLTPARSAAVQRESIAYAVETIDSDNTTCDGENVILCDSGPGEVRYNRLFLIGSDQSIKRYSGESYQTPILERTGFFFVGPDKIDEYNYKRVIAVRLDVSGPFGAQINVWVGTKVGLNYVWTDPPVVYTIGTSIEVQVSIVGREFGFAFSWSDPEIRFYGYYVEMVEQRQAL